MTTCTEAGGFDVLSCSTAGIACVAVLRGSAPRRGLASVRGSPAPQPPRRASPRSRRRRQPGARADRAGAAAAAGAAGVAPAPAAPDRSTLGVPIYPGAQFIASYDAGRGQRYYIFGSDTSFIDLVTYYRTMLKQKGELVYDVPATHEFDIGKFNEDTHGVSARRDGQGLSVGRLGRAIRTRSRGGQPARFPTVIQIVPVVDADRGSLRNVSEDLKTAAATRPEILESHPIEFSHP